MRLTGRPGDRRALRAGQRGQAIVEMALILPLFLLLVFGVIEFGKAFNYWIDLTHLANEGSRYAAVNKWPGCPDDDTSACASAPAGCVATYSCTSYAKLSDYVISKANTNELQTGGTPYVQGKLGVTVCYPTGTGARGEPVRVKVTTKYKLPIVDGMLKLFRLNEVAPTGITMSVSSTMRLERDPTANRLGLENPTSC